MIILVCLLCTDVFLNEILIAILIRLSPIPLTVLAMYLIFYGIKIYKRGVYIGVKKKSYKDLQTLNRDINDNYSPAIVSYLYNQQIELKKDLVASLLNLEARGYIKRDIENQYCIKKLECSELGKDDLYLYNEIKENNLQNISYKEWFKCIAEEYDNKKFYKKKRILDFWKTIGKQLIINIIIFKIINYIYVNTEGEIAAMRLIMYSGIFLIAANILFFAIYYSVRKAIYKNKIVLSNYGKQELKKWIKFENFIKEYTLIKEKSANDMIIYGKFIPYAMVLNLNTDYINEADKIFGEFKSKELEITLEKEEVLNEIFGKM